MSRDDYSNGETTFIYIYFFVMMVSVIIVYRPHYSVNACHVLHTGRAVMDLPGQVCVVKRGGRVAQRTNELECSAVCSTVEESAVQRVCRVERLTVN